MHVAGRRLDDRLAAGGAREPEERSRALPAVAEIPERSGFLR